jgi:hypothetical protein
MKLIKNVGNERVVDELNRNISKDAVLDLASSTFSLMAFGEILRALEQLKSCRLVLPSYPGSDLALLGHDEDRAFRNRLNAPWLARRCSEWLSKVADVRFVPSPLPQCLMMVVPASTGQRQVIAGHCPFSTEGLGITAGNQFGLVQVSEHDDECTMFSNWFESIWKSATTDGSKQGLMGHLQRIAEPKSPAVNYYSILSHVFKNLGNDLDEEKVVKSATGIRKTVVWRKLFKFQRDGVVGAIDKLERFGGCIIADSVGLGKTFQALAVIKYHELRNDRVLVLAPNPATR